MIKKTEMAKQIKKQENEILTLKRMLVGARQDLENLAKSNEYMETQIRDLNERIFDLKSEIAIYEREKITMRSIIIDAMRR